MLLMEWNGLHPYQASAFDSSQRSEALNQVSIYSCVKTFTDKKLN